MGLFDGHGLYGHKVSSMVMSTMSDYIKHSKYFTEKKLQRMSAEEIESALRKCFRYAQDQVKEQFKDFLRAQKRKKREEEYGHQHKHFKPNNPKK